MTKPKSIKRIIITLIIVVVVCFCVFAGFVFAVGMILSNGNRLKSVVKSQFGVELNFKDYQMRWHGIHPDITATDLTVAKVGHKPVLSFKSLDVSVNPWDSLLFFRPVTNSLRVSGLHMLLTQSLSGRYRLTGFEKNMTASGWPSLVKKSLYMLAPQYKINITNANIFVFRKNLKPVHLSDLNLKWGQNAPQNYTFQLTTNLPDAKGHFKLLANIFGHLSNRKSVHADIYASISGQNLAHLIGRSIDEFIVWKKLKGKVQVWMHASRGHITSVHSVVNLADFNALNLSTLYSYRLPYFKTNMIWQRQKNGKGWTFAAKPFVYKTDNILVKDGGLYLSDMSFNKNTISISAQAKEFDLSLFSHLAGLTPPALGNSFLRTVANLDGQGLLKKLDFTGQLVNHVLVKYGLRANFSNLGEANYAEFPGFKNLSGQVVANTKSGELTINSKGFELQKTSFLTHDWAPADLAGKFSWFQLGQKLEINVIPLRYKTNHLSEYATGQISVKNWDLKDAHINLLAAVNTYGLQHNLKPYLPEKLVKPMLYKWLTHNIVKAPNADFQMLIHGELSQMPFEHRSGVFQVLGQVKNGSMIPWVKWPLATKVSGVLKFYDEAFFANVPTWETTGIPIDDTTLSVPNLMKGVPTVFAIHGSAKATGPKVRNFVIHSPLDSQLAVVPKLQIFGPVGLQLNMLFPMSSKAKNSITGTVFLKQNRVSIKGVPLWLRNITGNVEFDGLNISTKKPLKAEFLKEPWVMIFKPHRVDASGLVNMAMLAKEVASPILHQVNGMARMNVSVVTQGQKATITAQSDLKNVSINLPAPFYKTYKKPLDFDLNLVSEGVTASGNLKLGKIATSQFKLITQKNGFITPYVQVMVNPKTAFSAPGKPGVYIAGSLPYMNLTNWATVFKGSNAKASEVQSLFKSLSLTVGNLKAFGSQYQNVLFTVIPVKSGMQAGFKGKKIEGDILLPKNPDNIGLNPIQVNFKTLYLGSKSKQQKATVAVESLSGLPSVAGSIKNLYWKGKLLGSFRLATLPVKGGIEFAKAHLHMKTAAISFTGSWVKHKGKSFVQLRVQAFGTDFGKALTAFGYPGVVGEGKGAVLFNGGWQGSLFKPDMKTLSGKASFDLTDGRLEGVNQGFSRLLGFFSVESIAKHLSLNFSDIGKKGMAFDTLTGLYKLRNGVASTTNLRVKNSSLRVNVLGSINISAKTMNQTVIALPNVSVGVAVAAGLVGGPILGIAAWVADKIISNTVLKDRGIVYHLQGKWGSEKSTKGK